MQSILVIPHGPNSHFRCCNFYIAARVNLMSGHVHYWCMQKDYYPICCLLTNLRKFNAGTRCQRKCILHVSEMTSLIQRATNTPKRCKLIRKRNSTEQKREMGNSWTIKYSGYNGNARNCKINYILYLRWHYYDIRANLGDRVDNMETTVIRTSYVSLELETNLTQWQIDSFKKRSYILHAAGSCGYKYYTSLVCRLHSSPDITAFHPIHRA